MNKLMELDLQILKKKAVLQLIQSLIKLLIDSDYEYIDFYNFGIDRKINKKCGFKLNTLNKKIVIPNYYEPFLRKNLTKFGVL